MLLARAAATRQIARRLRIAPGLPALQAQLLAGIDAGALWLTEGPLQLSPLQLSAVRDQLLATLSANQANITAGALTTAATVGQTATEMLLVLFTLVAVALDRQRQVVAAGEADPAHDVGRVVTQDRQRPCPVTDLAAYTARGTRCASPPLS